VASFAAERRALLTSTHASCHWGLDSLTRHKLRDSEGGKPPGDAEHKDDSGQSKAAKQNNHPEREANHEAFDEERQIISSPRSPVQTLALRRYA
jgi:hypothetical protein